MATQSGKNTDVLRKKVNPADLFIRDSSRSKVELKDSLKTYFDTILARL